MGVEYRHFLVAGDPGWLPQPETLSRIDALLSKWGLVSDAPKVYDLSAGKKRSLKGLPQSSPGPGIAALYPMVEGSAVAKIFGPSYDGIPDDGRYIQGIAVVVGLDYRVHWSSEGLCFTVEAPAREGTRDIEPYDDDNDLGLYAECYPAGPSTTPPTVEVDIDQSVKANVAWSGYTGVWRAAVILDCGKDLPKFIEGPLALPSRSFVTNVSDALRSRLHEVGEIY